MFDLRDLDVRDMFKERNSGIIRDLPVLDRLMAFPGKVCCCFYTS